jgi:predicted DNA binding CopG/RHH family protein
MIANNEYMENIARKLDSLNKINGFNPQSNSTLKDNFDVIDYTGQAAINYMKKKQIENQSVQLIIDPLFKDHNTY